MRTRSLIVGLVVSAVCLGGAASAQATPTSTGKLTLQGRGTIYKDVQRPVNLTLDVNVIPETGAPTLKPLVNVKTDFPVGLSLVSHSDKTPVCPVSEIGPEHANFPTSTAIGLCPKSLVGDGNADLFVAQATGAFVNDPILTLFNGGVDDQGNTRVVIHGYSANLNQGIYMSGLVKNGQLSVDIPRLTYDTSVPRFQINIPGAIGLDPNYAVASCPTGNWHAIAEVTLAKRDAGGVESERETLSPPATSDQACQGAKGKAQLAQLKIKGPKKVKSGKKGAFKVTIKNTGTGNANKVKITASGAGKGSASAGTIKAGGSKTVTVKAKVKGKRGRKATVKFKASGGATSAGKTKVSIG